MNTTPDTEVEEYINLKHIPLGDMTIIFMDEGLRGIQQRYDKIISSRDTYWKERVEYERKESYAQGYNKGSYESGELWKERVRKEVEGMKHTQADCSNEDKKKLCDTCSRHNYEIYRVLEAIKSIR